MDGSAIALFVMCLGASAYLAWLVCDGLKTGMLQPPGAGEPLSRERWPKMFGISIALYGLAVVISMALAILVLTGLGH
jgi:hypothetical protein